MTGPLRRFSFPILSSAFLIAACCAAGPQAGAAPGDGSPEKRPAVLPLHVWDEQPDWITSLMFLKDGHHFCAGTYEQLLVFDARDAGSPKSVPLQPGYVKALALSPDGKTLACGQYQAVSLLDAATFAVKRTLGDYAGYVTGLAFSPDGRQLATATEAADNESARVFDVASGKAVHVLGGHRFPVRAIAFSADGKRIATAAGDEDRVTQPGEVKVWNAADGKELNSFSNPKRAATGVAFSPDGKYLASSGFDERVIVYDLSKGKAISFFAGHSRPTNAVLFARGGSVVVSASGGRARGGNEVKIWERESGTELAAIVGHTARIDAIALSADESLLATGGYDKRVAVWDLKPVWKVDAPPQPGSTAAPGASKKIAMKAETASKSSAPQKVGAKALLRVGMIGLDTSHCAAFTQVLNDPKASPDVAGFRVVAAYPRGSADIVSSTERIPEYTKDFRKRGVEIVDSISALLPKVDVVLLETNDGRPHLEQALTVMKAGKPLFIDKPIAGSLADAIAIFEAAKRYHVPVFSSSSLRFGKHTLEARNGKIGVVQSCETTSPCTLEKTHPDLFWYGIHGVESLFTVMGAGCKSVRRTQSTATDDVVVGQWEGGRVGTFHGTRSKASGYGGKATGTKGSLDVGSYDGYRPLVVAIVNFFRTGIAPVKEDETLEIYAFMEAADESKRQHGAEVTLASVMAKARVAAEKRLRQLL